MGLKRISVSLVFQQVIQIQYHQVLIIQFIIQATSCHRFSTFHLFILVFKEERHAVPQTLRIPLPCQPFSSSCHGLFSSQSQTTASLAGTTSAPIPWLLSPPPAAASRGACPSTELEPIPPMSHNWFVPSSTPHFNAGRFDQLEAALLGIGTAGLWTRVENKPGKYDPNSAENFMASFK